MQAARGAAVATDDVTVDVRTRPATRWVWITALVVLAVDAVSKALVVAKLSDRSPVHLIGHVLQLTVTRNGGAAFSVGTGATILFTAVAVVVVVIIARTARRLCSRAWAVSFGLLLGGALGNLSDRLFRSPGVFRGHVVDWIELPHWPIFNLADSAIVLGGVLAVLLSLLGVELDRSSR
jgi:signal peptidase II